MRRRDFVARLRGRDLESRWSNESRRNERAKREGHERARVSRRFTRTETVVWLLFSQLRIGLEFPV